MRHDLVHLYQSGLFLALYWAVFVLLGEPGPSHAVDASRRFRVKVVMFVVAAAAVLTHLYVALDPS